MRTLLPWVVAGLVITALFWIDPLFIPLALLGPIVTGAWAGFTATSRSSTPRLARRRAAPAV